MKRNNLILIAFLSFMKFFSQNNINTMNDFKIIDKNDLDLKALIYIQNDKSNSANIYENKSTGDLIIYPQKGNRVLFFDNRISFDKFMNDKYYPLLEENRSIYLDNSDFFKIDNNKMINTDIADEYMISKFKLTNNILSEDNLSRLEKQYKDLDLNERREMFPYLLVSFADKIQKKTNTFWETEQEKYFVPYFIPFLFDPSNDISLYSLNEELLKKTDNQSSKSFKSILIEVYCDYYNKRFYSTNQNNYFEKKEYKKLLLKDFDKYFTFPFIDIWQMPKI